MCDTVHSSVHYVNINNGIQHKIALILTLAAFSFIILKQHTPNSSPQNNFVYILSEQVYDVAL